MLAIWASMKMKNKLNKLKKGFTLKYLQKRTSNSVFFALFVDPFTAS